MKNNHIHFTKKAIAELPIPPVGSKPVTYYDTGCRDGLCIIVTYGGTKTFYFFMKFNGTPKRVKLGRVGDIELIDARARAHTLREEATVHGIDPSEKRKNSLRDITLNQFYYDVYLPKHSEINKKPKTIINENSSFKNNLAALANRKMMSITHDDVMALHTKLKKTSGLYSANRALALLKNIYNKALEWGLPRDFENPAMRIKMFKEKSRERYLKADEMERFFGALENTPNELFRNYVLLSLYLGQRRGNILSMRWRDIDWDNKLVHFADTKNGDSLNVPLTSYAYDLLRDMHAFKINEWVLPSHSSKSGHYESPKNAWAELLKRAGVEDLRIHDLRRTMGSYQAITGSSLNIIGKSLGHKSLTATQIYARLSSDPIRESMERATDKMMKKE